MGKTLTLISAIIDCVASISSNFVAVFVKLLSYPSVMTLIGLAIYYGIVKFVINFLPTVKSD